MLNPGKSSHLDDEVSLRVVEAKPFGRATYLGLATYAVIPWQVMPVHRDLRESIENCI